MPGEKKVEKSDNSALKFAAAADVDSGGRKGLPDDALTNVGGDEQVDTTAESVTLLEEFVEEDDDEGGRDELDDEQEADGPRQEAAPTALTTRTRGKSCSGNSGDGLRASAR